MKRRELSDFFDGEYPRDEPVDLDMIDQLGLEDLATDSRSGEAKPVPFSSYPDDVQADFWHQLDQIKERRSQERRQVSLLASRKHDRHAGINIIIPGPAKALILRHGSQRPYDLISDSEQLERLYFGVNMYRHDLLEQTAGLARNHQPQAATLDKIALDAHLGDQLSKVVAEGEVSFHCYGIEPKGSLYAVLGWNTADQLLVGHCYFECPCFPGTSSISSGGGAAN